MSKINKLNQYNLESIGKGIAHKRKLAGFTQAEVAERLGMNKDTVSRIENGIIMPTLPRLVQFAALFDCIIGEFFWFDEDTETRIWSTMLLLKKLPEDKILIALNILKDLVKLAE